MSDMEEVSGGDVDGRRDVIQEGGGAGASTVEIGGEAAIAGVGEKEEEGWTFTTITAAIVSD